MEKGAIVQLLQTQLSEQLEDAKVLQTYQLNELTTVFRVKDTTQNIFEVKIQKSNTLEAFNPGQWVSKIKAERARLESLVHPQIMSSICYLFNSSETICEYLNEDCGLPLSSLTIPKTPAMWLQLIRNTLDALAHIEQQGYSCPTFSGASICYNELTGLFKLQDTVLAQAVPKSIVEKAYDKLKDVPIHHAAPELCSLLLDNCLPDSPRAKCITDEIPEPNLSRQDVYAWGSIVFHFITACWCLPKAKLSQEQYDGYLLSLANWSGKDDASNLAIHKIRPLLKAALAYDPKQRPSFSTLRDVYIASEALSEAEMNAKLAGRCKVCGSVAKTAADECPVYMYVLNYICVASPSEAWKSELLAEFKKNPYIMQRMLEIEESLDVLKVNKILSYIKENCGAAKNVLLIEALKEVIISYIKKADFVFANRFFAQLLHLEEAVFGEDREPLALLNVSIVSLLLPL